MARAIASRILHTHTHRVPRATYRRYGFRDDDGRLAEIAAAGGSLGYVVCVNGNARHCVYVCVCRLADLSSGAVLSCLLMDARRVRINYEEGGYCGGRYAAFCFF